MTTTQMSYNEKFDNIVEEPPEFIDKFYLLPKNIRDYVEENTKKIYLYSLADEENCCSKCLKTLSDGYCENCQISYDLNNSKNKININSKKERNYTEDYFIFDVQDNNILLYNILLFNDYFEYDYLIKEVYWIKKNGLYQLKAKKYIDYDDSDYLKKQMLYIPIKNLYLDNLLELKNTDLYKYSNIWNAKNYLESISVNLKSLTYFPLCCPEFEYLIKMKLFNLAFYSADLIKFQQNFENTFGIEKKYYGFLKKHDLSFRELKVLRLYKTTSVKLINKLSIFYEVLEETGKYVKIEKLVKYINDNDLSIEDIRIYFLYLDYARNLGFNLDDNKTIYPDNLQEMYAKLQLKYESIFNNKFDEDIKEIANKLSLMNSYEDDDFIIYPASSVESIINEGFQQHNCVSEFCQEYAQNATQIYFLRKKDNINESHVTIQVKDCKIIQARVKYNKEPSKELNKILKEWERDLIPVLLN